MRYKISIVQFPIKLMGRKQFLVKMLSKLRRTFLIYLKQDGLQDMKLIPDSATGPLWEQNALWTFLFLTLSALVCKRKTKLRKELSIQESRTKDPKKKVISVLIASVIMAFIFTNFIKFLQETLFG